MATATQQLPTLPEVERLSPACLRILGGNPGKFTLQGTNTYVLGTGASRILVDTGEGKPSWAAALRRTLERENAAVTQALITHWHPDHVGGIAQLRELFPDAEVYKNQSVAAGERQQEQLDIADGQEFRVEGATLRAVHTPGHAADHMVFVLEEEDALFTGDNVLGHGTAVFEDLAVYLRSLARMGGLFRGRAYPGHGPVLADGPGRVREYIAHRREREEQVLQTLRSPNNDNANITKEEAADESAWTAMELVKVIYSDVREDLHPAAEKGLLQILDKLDKEGRVVKEDGGRWRVKARSPL